MKRKISIIIAAVFAVIFVSCSMVNTDETQNGSDSTKTAYLTISLGEVARTALPSVSNVENFDSFALVGTVISGNGIAVSQTWTGDANKAAYEKMHVANIAVTAGSSYTFILTAKKNGATWSGTATKQIIQGSNTLSFTLALASLGTEGEGAINVALSVPAVVKKVDAELKTADEASTITPQDASVSFTEGTVTYTASDIAAGNYVLIFTLWGDDAKTLKLGEWREYAGITDGVTSSSSSAIASADDLESIYQITLETNGGTLTGSVPSFYTRFSGDIALPTTSSISKDSNIFKGWKETDTDGNPVGDVITTINAGSTGNKIIAAQWAISGIFSAENAFCINVEADNDPSSGNGAW